MKLFTRCRSLQVTSARLLAMAVGICLPAGITGSEAPRETIVPLEYREVEHRVADFYLSVIPASAAFLQEPSLEESGVRRGRIQLGEPMAFLWDWRNGRVYLDLNRNDDLTDDTDGIFTASAQPASNRRHQTFPGIRLNLPTASGSCPALLDLTLSEFMQLHAQVGLRSFFSGQGVLGEREWEVGVVHGSGAPNQPMGNASMLLRPWSQREEPFKIDRGTTDAFPFPSNLFVQGEAYRILHAFDLGQSPPIGRLTFTRAEAPTGWLEFHGAFVPRLILMDGPWTCVIDDPAGVVSLPLGSYQAYRIQVQHRDAIARPNTHSDRGVLQRVVIQPERVARLAAGGPLTNMVEVHRRSQHVVFNHWLAGADGHRYRMIEPVQGQPPRFTVYQGDKAIASGNFEFG
jgi:hypothetical protein